MKTNEQTKETAVAKTDEQRKAEKQAKAEAKARENAAKHEHAKPDTLRWDAEAGKFAVLVRCSGCGAVRRVFTSDLFQVRFCVACTEQARKERRKAKRQEKAEEKKATQAKQAA